MFDPFGRRGPRKGTGMWPFVNPRPWDMSLEPGQIVITDPVAVSSEAARELRRVEWPGMALVDDDFQMSLLDAGADVGAMAEDWFERNRALVAAEIGRREPKKVVDGLLRLLRDTLMIREDPIESMSMYDFIDERLFASCRDETDAAARGDVPNRHAEIHAMKSYGTLRGASYMLCGIDLLLRLATRNLDRGLRT